MKFSLKALAVAALLAGPTVASAQTYNLYVGYADGLRSGGFFPNPWAGDPSVQFFSGFSGSDPDAGAIMFQNTGTTTLFIKGLTYSLAAGGGGGSYNYDFTPRLGVAGFALDPGKFGIFTGLDNGGDFDSSDFGVGPCGNPNTSNPQLAVNVSGTAANFFDTGHILDTGGQDQANCGIGTPADFNESFGWRVIGTAGVDTRTNNLGTVPEPSTIALTSAGLLLIVGIARRRKAA